MANTGLSISKLRSMSISQFKGINKDDLYNIIQSDDGESNYDIKTLKDSIASLSTTIQNLSCQVKELTELKQKVACIPDLQKSVANLTATSNLQSRIIEQQQIFIEKLDAKEREKNIVITGINEFADFEGKQTDDEKCKLIFDTIDVQPGRFTTKRLGKQNQDRIRPILVTLENTDVKDKILSEAKKLKSAGQLYKKIYIKRDVPPAVRREWKRLYDSLEVEKNKPENVGHSVTIDKRKRQIIRDGQVIDKWNVNFLV